MKKKISIWERHRRIQRVLERYGRFDYDYIPFGNTWYLPDAKYRYRENTFERIIAFLVRLFMATAGVLLIKIWYGAKVVGKENLKAVKGKGTIAVTNHFSYLDILITRYGTGYFRSYVTVAPWNNKRGFGGWLMRRAGILPFSPNLTATRNLWREIDYLLQKNKLVSFYAEQAMWVGYEKPRPMKDGAYFFAVKHNVPVLPVFVTFEKNRHGLMRRTRVHVLPAVFPDESLPKNERGKAMLAVAQREWTECYEKAYGKALTYETNERTEETPRT